MKLVLTPLAILLVVVVVFWLGLQVKPAPFPAAARQQPPLDSAAVPKGLPAPVERFFRARYGDAVPAITSAVMTGRGSITMGPVKLPIRLRFTHVAGKDYRHYFEGTWFGLTVLKINESYVAGKERMEFPWGALTDNPKLDQGGNAGMWAELLLWAPAVLATDPRVRWEAVDDESAFMVVPFGKETERFLVRFDPANGGLKYWEVMRYKNGEGEKILWINGTWFQGDSGIPWADFNVEETYFNVAVDVKAKGL